MKIVKAAAITLVGPLVGLFVAFFLELLALPPFPNLVANGSHASPVDGSHIGYLVAFLVISIPLSALLARIVLGDSEDTQDLVAALNFVSKQIEAEANLEGQPLNHDERALLHNLPRSFRVTLHTLRLCSIAKAAYRTDLSLSHGRSGDWKFAAAVSKLHGHPMAWLLEWSSVEVRPWWDKWLLLIAAFLVVVVGLTYGYIVAGLFTRHAVSLASGVTAHGQPMAPAGFIVAHLIGVALLLAICFGPRYIERSQLKQTVEDCRRSSAGQIM